MGLAQIIDQYDTVYIDGSGSMALFQLQLEHVTRVCMWLHKPIFGFDRHGIYPVLSAVWDQILSFERGGSTEVVRVIQEAQQKGQRKIVIYTDCTEEMSRHDLFPDCSRINVTVIDVKGGPIRAHGGEWTP